MDTTPDASRWDAIARGLSLRVGGTHAPAAVTLRILHRPTHRATGSAPPASWTPAASDDRGTAWRTPAGTAWTCPGYTIEIPHDTTSATVSLATLQRAVTAHAFRQALTLLLPRVGWMPLHGAGICIPGGSSLPNAAPLAGERAVLLVGPSGCGKSTLTTGLLRRGWPCISDDLLLFAPSDAPDTAPCAWSLTREIRLCPDAWQRFGFGDGEQDKAASLFGADASGTPKPVVPTHRFSAPPVSHGTPQCIVLPSIVDHATSRLTPVSSTEALPALLQQMQPPALLPPAVAQTQLDRAAALVRTCDVVRLEAGRDLYRDPGRLAIVLDDVLHPAA